MVDDEILLLDGDETIAAILAHALGKARIVRLELEVGPIDADRSPRARSSASMPSRTKISSLPTSSSLGDEAAQLLGHEAVDFEPDDRAAAAPLQRGLEQQHEIFGLFLDLEIAVANDPEEARAAHHDSPETALG